MNKKLIIIVIVLVVLGGGGYWLANRNKNNDKNSQTSSNTSSNNNAAFDALATSGSSYVATINTTANGKTTSATMEYDKNTGAIQYSIGSGSSKSTIIYTKDAYYICQTSTKCFKYATANNSASGFDPSAYEYSSDKLASLRNTAVDQGTKPCPSGTCHVWQVTNGGYSSTVYIDTSSKRIIEVDGASAAGSAKVIYDYKDVSVTVPANAQSLPSSNPSSTSPY